MFDKVKTALQENQGPLLALGAIAVLAGLSVANEKGLLPRGSGDTDYDYDDDGSPNYGYEY